MATPGYFQTMGMTLENGRHFTDQDREDTAAVLIVNASMARKVWPNESPIGKQLMLDYNRGKYAYTVVGVTRGIRYYGLKRQPEPEVFIPHAQNGYLPMNIVIRAAADPGNLNEAVKRELHAIDPAQPGHHFATMQQLMAHSIAADRFSTCLLGVLSAAALFLAALGTYSAMAFAVEERVREIGIRLALGAQRRDVWRLVLGQGMMLAAAGVAIGLAAALALTRSMQSLLFEVSATDLGTFVTVAAVLAAVALLACWLPARRATRIDPLVSIRHD
jgi:putative ABC transport system permease protein